MTQPLSRTYSANSSCASACYQSSIPYVLLITLLCFSTQFTWARRNDKDQYPNLATDIADHYIRSFASDAQDEESEPTAATTAQKKAATTFRPPKLDATTKRKVLFNTILAKSEKFDRIQQHMEPILNEYAWDDLNLFYGTPSAPGYHLLSRIDRTTTTLGEAVLAALLATPTSNLKVLGHRQHILRTFLDDPLAVKKLKDAFETFKDSEQSLISFWTNTDPVYTKSYQNALNQIYSTWSEEINKSASWLEFNKRFFVDLFIVRALCVDWICKIYCTCQFKFMRKMFIEDYAKRVARQILQPDTMCSSVQQQLSTKIQQALFNKKLRPALPRIIKKIHTFSPWRVYYKGGYG